MFCTLVLQRCMHILFFVLEGFNSRVLLYKKLHWLINMISNSFNIHFCTLSLSIINSIYGSIRKTPNIKNIVKIQWNTAFGSYWTCLIFSNSCVLKSHNKQKGFKLNFLTAVITVYNNVKYILKSPKPKQQTNREHTHIHHTCAQKQFPILW